MTSVAPGVHVKARSDLGAGLIGHVYRNGKMGRFVVPTMASLPERFDDRAVGSRGS